eukprot:12522978-Ditylum_brightwellii.AAC.1
MQPLFEVFAIASDDEFIMHASTICTSYQLNLLLIMGVEELLNNMESFSQSRVKSNKWAKAVDSDQQSAFVTKSGPCEQHSFYNCREKGGTSKSHILPDYIHSSKLCNIPNGRGQGHEGGQGQGQGSGHGACGDPQQQQQKTVYPKAGEPHVHTVKDITEHWCGQCTIWKKDH